jgi:hypothetical protein
VASNENTKLECTVQQDAAIQVLHIRDVIKFKQLRFRVSSIQLIERFELYVPKIFRIIKEKYLFSLEVQKSREIFNAAIMVPAKC